MTPQAREAVRTAPSEVLGDGTSRWEQEPRIVTRRARPVDRCQNPPVPLGAVTSAEDSAGRLELGLAGIIDAMFERLSVSSRQALVRARDESDRAADGLALNSGHLLIGLAGRPGDQAERALSAVGVSAAELRELLEGGSRLDLERAPLGQFSKELATVLRAAVDRRAESAEVTTGDLLLAVLDAQGSAGAAIMQTSGLVLRLLRQAALRELPEPDPPWPIGEGVWLVTIDGEEEPPVLRWADHQADDR